MSLWPSAKARRVLVALLKIGWQVKRQTGSHKTLSREGWADVVFAFHDGEEIGPRMLVRIAKHTDYDAMRAKGDHALAGIKLVSWGSVPPERRAVLWRRMLRGRVANAHQFSPTLSAVV